ncbi:hypothetical protein SLA2020_346550 [Shorea laevis]
MSWFSVILFLSFTFSTLSEAGHHGKNPSAIVVGTVYCDTCFQQGFSRNSHFIPGASVLVECKDGNSKEGFRQEVKTDEHGEFRVDLPFTVSKHIKKIEGCSVKLINSSEPYCAVASSATSSSLHLKSRKEGIHIFSAGFFTFKPLKQPILCNEKPSVQYSSKFNNRKTSIGSSDELAFPPPIKDPTKPEFPPLPILPNLPPLPQLPPLPPLPGLPSLPPLPGKGTQSSDQKAVHPQSFFPPFLPPNPLKPPPLLPPNPLKPPAPLLPPNPLQPPAPLLPPNPLQPPPAPLIPLPPIPGLTPSPPPPAFPIPLPPFPFPSPPFPGIPPASTP